MTKVHCPGCADTLVDLPRWDFADTTVDVPYCAGCRAATPGIVRATIKITGVRSLVPKGILT